MQSFCFKQPILVLASACSGGVMEKEGPLGDYLDYCDESGKFEGVIDVLNEFMKTTSKLQFILHSENFDS